MSVVDLVLQLALGIVLTAGVLRRDMRRLSPLRFARSWSEASFWSAVVAFGPLCIAVHFVRTRRSLSGFAVGVGWMALVLLTIALLSEAVQWVVETLS